MVGARGIEPPTSCSQSKHSTRLSYAPKEAEVYQNSGDLYGICQSLGQLIGQFGITDLNHESQDRFRPRRSNQHATTILEFSFNLGLRAAQRRVAAPVKPGTDPNVKQALRHQNHVANEFSEFKPA